MGVRTVKRIASQLLKVGINRVKIKPESIKDVEEAMSRNDVKELIKKGIIFKSPVKGKRKKEKEKRANKGRGRRKGSKYSRKRKKEHWMEKVRALREALKILVEKGFLEKAEKRKIYNKIKGNLFRGKKAMLNYLKEHKLLKGKVEEALKVIKKEKEEKAKQKLTKAKKSKAKESEKKEKKNEKTKKSKSSKEVRK